MNLPNILTLSRIPLLFAIVLLFDRVLIFPYANTVAFLLFVAGALSDWLDGYIARKQGLTTDFGKLMDALVDKIFMVGLFIAFALRGVFDEGLTIPPFFTGLFQGDTIWFLLIIITREFYVSGLRMVAGAKGVVLAAEQMGKIKTALQMACGGCILLSSALLRDFGQLQIGEFFYLIGRGCFYLAALQTLLSGLIYAWKYRHLANA